MPFVAKSDAIAYENRSGFAIIGETTLRFTYEAGDVIEFGLDIGPFPIDVEDLGTGNTQFVGPAFAVGTGTGDDDVAIVAILGPMMAEGGSVNYVIPLQGDGLLPLDGDARLETYFTRLGYDDLTDGAPADSRYGENRSLPFEEIDGIEFLGETGVSLLSGNDADRETRAESIAYLYEAGLDRDGNIDEGGLNFWIDAAGHGLTDRQLARAFIESTEFESAFGAPETLTDEQYVEQLYQNVLDRASDQTGFDF